MSHYKSIEDYVGNTPLVRLKRMPGATTNPEFKAFRETVVKITVIGTGYVGLVTV